MDQKLSKTAPTGSVHAPYRVGILAVPGFALMSYACSVEPLRAANLLSRRTLYEVLHFGSGAQVGSSGDASVRQQYEIGAQVDLDLVLVVAGGDPFAYRDPAAFAWLRQLARRGVRIGGVSGGAVILANAGVMSGRRATVHWEHAPALAERHLDIMIERRLYVMDRDRVTCGGGTAPLDLMHALIASHHGRAFARRVSDWFLHTDIRGAEDPQRAGVVERHGAHSPHVVEAVLAMESHIGDPLNLSQFSMITGVSHRHLNRLFVAAFGQSVMEFYRRLRLDTAKQLVRGSAMSFTEIAEATGFSNPGHFSNAYTAQFGQRPTVDRKPAAAEQT